MKYYVKAVVPLIQARYDDFTHSERNIADFFLHNRESQDFSAKTISKKLFVSEAALSRFSKKCGFSGYREFIFQYTAALSENVERAAKSSHSVLDMYQGLLNRAYDLLDEAQVERVIQAMSDAKRVFVCGRGSSGLAASEMESRFMRIGVDIDSLRDSDRIRMQAVFVSRCDMVIGMSISGETREVLYLLSEAKKRGAASILLTSSSRAVLKEYCDEVILVPSLKHLEEGNAISPQFPLLLMTDILYFYYSARNHAGHEEMHEGTLQALQKGKDIL